jgi:hypothetical protein
MCDEWRNSFAAFYRDMGPRPAGASIDRIDNNRGYEPGNCQWSTPQAQANNRRRNIMVDGMTLKQFTDLHGVNYKVLHARMNRSGDSPHVVLDRIKRESAHDSSLKRVAALPFHRER